MNYKTKGTCSREISFDVVDNKIINNSPIINFFILFSPSKYKKDAKSYLLSKTLHPLINPFMLYAVLFNSAFN